MTHTRHFYSVYSRRGPGLGALLGVCSRGGLCFWTHSKPLSILPLAEAIKLILNCASPLGASLVSGFLVGPLVLGMRMSHRSHPIPSRLKFEWDACVALPFLFHHIPCFALRSESLSAVPRHLPAPSFYALPILSNCRPT